MNFLLELNLFISSHAVTSKQPHKVVQIHMGHPVEALNVHVYSYVSSREECSNKGGTNAGSCASGFGVCCTCKISISILLEFVIVVNAT